MLKSDPVKLPFQISINLKGYSLGTFLKCSSASVYGRDSEGNLITLPVTLYKGDNDYIVVAPSGRVSIAHGQNFESGFRLVGQTPLPFGGSFQSEDEAAFRAARELI